MAALKLSVLDQSPISEGSTGAQALRQSIDLARLADRLGYHRYWVAEHHGGPMLAGPSPEVLIGPIASATERIRVGSGGRDAAPLQPVQGGRELQPAGRAVPGADRSGAGPRVGHRPDDRARAAARPHPADARTTSPTSWPSCWPTWRTGCRPAIPFARLAKALPGLPERPEPWLLGRSQQSAVWAGELGLPYAFADFINPDGAADRRSCTGTSSWTPSGWPHRGWPSAPGRSRRTREQEAHELASSSMMAMRELRAGRLIAVPPVEKALRYLERQGDGVPAGGGRRMTLGTGEQVRAGLEELAESTGPRR